MIVTAEPLTLKARALIGELEAAEAILKRRQGDFSFAAGTAGDDRTIALMNIRYDLRQAVLTLRLLTDRLLTIRERERFVRERQLQDGPVSEGPVLDSIRLVQRLSEENEIYIKVLYHTLYEIQELLEVDALKDEVRKDVRDELDRICTFRSKVVVHKKGQRVHLRGTRKWHADHLEQTFGHAVFAGSDIAQAVGPVWARAKVHLPESHRDEENAFERMAVLYSSMCTLPGELRAEVKALIEKYGVGSDTPRVIAKLVHGLCVALVEEHPLST